MRGYEYITICKREPVLSPPVILFILDVYDLEEIELLKEPFQEVYDSKIADAAHIKEIVKVSDRVLTALFTWSIFADRLDHFIETFLPLKPERKDAIFYEIYNSLSIRGYRKLKDRFTQKFLDYQLDMLQDKTLLFLLNREINSLTDLFLKVYCDERFDRNNFTFQSFINNRVNTSLYRELYLTSADVELINSLYVASKNNLHIDIDIINKLRIENIKDLLNLNNKYLISDISLSKNSVLSLTSETLDLYMKRLQEESAFYGIHSRTVSKILEFINPEVLTDELVKKYYPKFFSSSRSLFVEKILMPRYSLKDMLKILEGSV